MKSINIVFLLLLAVGYSAASSHANNDFHQSNNLRGAVPVPPIENYVDASEIIERIEINPSNSTNLRRELQSGKLSRSKQWLVAHNERRKKYHKMYNTTVVLLQWSAGLKKEAKAWANELVKTCTTKLASTNYGVNIAAKVGQQSALRSPEEILEFWESKLNMGASRNSEITQVLWRATHYVGCADARSKPVTDGSGSGKQCSFSVCYYARPGNCDMARYKGDWETPTFKDTSACPPACAPDKTC